MKTRNKSCFTHVNTGYKDAQEPNPVPNWSATWDNGSFVLRRVKASGNGLYKLIIRVLKLTGVPVLTSSDVYQAITLSQR